jgi:hypothetical protein
MQNEKCKMSNEGQLPFPILHFALNILHFAFAVSLRRVLPTLARFIIKHAALGRRKASLEFLR